MFRRVAGGAWRVLAAALLLLAGGCSPAANPPPSAPAVAPRAQPSAPAGRASAITLTSSAFSDGGTIPAACTCDGGDRAPSLSWSGAPAGARSFALIMHDPDAPAGDFTHWLLYDIPASVLRIPEGGAAGTAATNDSAGPRRKRARGLR